MNFIKSFFKDENRLPTYEECKKYDYTFKDNKEPLLKQSDDDLPTYEQLMFERIQNKIKEAELIEQIESGKKQDWYDISENYVLSENFIRQYKEKVCWHDIKKYQELSYNFKAEFKDILSKIKI